MSEKSWMTEGMQIQQVPEYRRTVLSVKTRRPFSFISLNVWSELPRLYLCAKRAIVVLPFGHSRFGARFRLRIEVKCRNRQ